MDSAAIIEFLKHLKAKNILGRGKWVQASCPLAPWTHDSGKDSRPSFAVRVEPNKESYFNCYVCHHGSLADLIFELQFHKAQHSGYDLGAAWELVAKEAENKLNLSIKEWGTAQEKSPEYVIPEEWLARFQLAWEVPYARDYLESRSVSAEIAALLDIRWDRSLRTVCFPIRNHVGDLVSLRGRRISPGPHTPAYHVYPWMGQQNGQAWLGEHCVDYDRPVLLVESVFDVASVFRVYRNVVAPLSVGINQARIKRIGKASEIVTLFDQGVGGDKARSIVAKHFGNALVTQVIPLKKDPGEMSEDQLREQLSSLLVLTKPKS